MRRRREALAVRIRPGVPVRLAVAVLALACALAVPVRLSADVWAYAAYGALLAHGADPWAHAYRAADVAPFADPLLDAALRAWDGSLPRDVYGPLFTVPCALVVAATRPLGPGGTILVLRVLAALALLGCIALAGRTRPRLASLLAFHPVVLWSAAEGHNDVFWLAPVLLSGQMRGETARLALLVAATAVKAIAVVPLVAALTGLRAKAGPIANVRTARDGSAGQRGVAAAVAFAALAVAYAPLAWSSVVHGVDHAAGPPRVSLIGAPALAAWSGSPIPLAVGGVLGALALAAVARALRGGDVLAGATLAGWVLLPSPAPWYAIWLVPVIALAGRTPASAALLAASFTGVAGYVQDAVPGTALRDPALLGGTMLALYALPLLLALAPAPSPQPNPAPPAPPPVATPAPAPAATTTPIPPTPTPAPATPAPQASASPNPFAYVVAPGPGPAGAPRILEIALNDRVLHKGGLLLVRITTSTDVTTVVARTMGHEIAVPQGAPGYFAGQEQLPSGIPFFLLGRSYQVEFVATTADGRSTTYSLPVRLER
ncbi:MAG: hypothetical protein QOD51_1171 [Candidatus Eremiobacteraeota bacterium]|nr:hypothetical protein [Candidatus Eremiobacteraeota bacterium]